MSKLKVFFELFKRYFIVTLYTPIGMKEDLERQVAILEANSNQLQAQLMDRKRLVETLEAQVKIIGRYFKSTINKCVMSNPQDLINKGEKVNLI